MNVLIVSPKFDPVVGGGETYVLNSARHLRAIGHDVIVATSPHEDRVLSTYDFDVVEIEGLDDDSLNIYTALPQLHKLIEKVCPDIIHAHGYFALLAVGLAREETCCDIVASIHSTPVWQERIIGSFKDFKSELAFARNVLKLSKPKCIIVGSQTYAKAADKITGGTILAIPLPYPVDMTFMQSGSQQLRKELAIGEDKVIVSIPSRILPRKGISEAVRALGHLPEEYVLCLPGAYDPLDKSYWNDIQAHKSWKKLVGRVVIPKRRISYTDLPNLYAMSDVIAMPSYYEGFGLAALESMAAGTPVIGTKVQGLQQLIVHNKNGLLIPPRDVSALAKAIIAVYNSKGVTSQLAAGGKLTAEDYSWDKHIVSLVDIYQQDYT